MTVHSFRAGWREVKSPCAKRGAYVILENGKFNWLFRNNLQSKPHRCKKVKYQSYLNRVNKKGSNNLLPFPDFNSLTLMLR